MDVEFCQMFFSTSVEMIVWFLSFILLIWIDLWVLNLFQILILDSYCLLATEETENWEGTDRGYESKSVSAYYKKPGSKKFKRVLKSGAELLTQWSCPFVALNAIDSVLLW